MELLYSISPSDVYTAHGVLLNAGLGPEISVNVSSLILYLCWMASFTRTEYRAWSGSIYAQAPWAFPDMWKTRITVKASVWQWNGMAPLGGWSGTDTAAGTAAAVDAAT